MESRMKHKTSFISKPLSKDLYSHNVATDLGFLENWKRPGKKSSEKRQERYPKWLSFPGF